MYMKKLNEVHRVPYYRNDGTIDSLQPMEECSIETSIGAVTPIYKVDDHGRKKLSPVKLHKNGSVKSVSLQRPYTVKTQIGDFEAELITFYPDGSLSRIFPLNGKLSGYWSEEDEYKLAETLTIPIDSGIIAAKPINMQFYRSGKLKSLTLWPRERICLITPIGELMVRKGISFHSDGSIQSCEPSEAVIVETKIGKIRAFDPLPDSIDGNKNSLFFDESGQVRSLSTTLDRVSAKDEWGTEMLFSPTMKPSLCSDKAYITKPLKITIEENKVVFENDQKAVESIHLNKSFTIDPFKSYLETQMAYCN